MTLGQRSFLEFDLPVEQIILIGKMTLAFANLDNEISATVAILEAGEPKRTEEGSLYWMAPQRAFHVTSTGPRIAALRKLVKQKGNSELEVLVREMRWAMAHVVKARNFVAHGVLAGGAGEPKTFWSQRRLKEMSLEDALATAPLIDYATRAIMIIRWRLLGITPPFALPNRPA
jgi:hypothetical protein